MTRKWPRPKICFIQKGTGRFSDQSIHHVWFNLFGQWIQMDLSSSTMYRCDSAPSHCEMGEIPDIYIRKFWRLTSMGQVWRHNIATFYRWMRLGILSDPFIWRGPLQYDPGTWYTVDLLEIPSGHNWRYRYEARKNLEAQRLAGGSPQAGGADAQGEHP